MVFKYFGKGDPTDFDDETAYFVAMDNDNFTMNIIMKVPKRDMENEYGYQDEKKGAARVRNLYLMAKGIDIPNWLQFCKKAHGGGFRLNCVTDAGFRYDPIRDAFISYSPHPSWKLVESLGWYVPPFDPPDDGKQYHWDESIVNWREYSGALPSSTNNSNG